MHGNRLQVTWKSIILQSFVAKVAQEPGLADKVPDSEQSNSVDYRNALDGN